MTLEQDEQKLSNLLNRNYICDETTMLSLLNIAANHHIPITYLSFNCAREQLASRFVWVIEHDDKYENSLKESLQELFN